MSDRYVNFPFRLDGDGRVAVTDESGYIRQRLEQILFTSPGERVMLPEFGCGIRNRVFAANNDLLSAASEFTIARAIHNHMGNLIMVNEVHVENVEEKLTVHIIYTKRRDLEKENTVFELLPLEQVS